MNKNIDASIIICTRNRSHAIEKALQATAQTMKAAQNKQTELIIVNNNSTDDTAEIIKAWKNKNPDIDCKILLETKPGLSHARNTGLLRSTGDIIAFTDDDCEMAEDYVSTAINLHQESQEPTFIGGRVILGNPDDYPTGIRPSTEFKEFRRAQNDARHDSLNVLLMGANITFPRAIFQTIGLFDTRLGAGTKLYGGEDLDYVIRAYIHGFPIQFVPELLIRHYHGRKESDALDLKKKYAIGTGALYTKYIFRHFNIIRPLIWDTKKLIKEIASGKNLLDPETGFSYKTMFSCMTKGCFLYLLSRK